MFTFGCVEHELRCEVESILSDFNSKADVFFVVITSDILIELVERIEFREREFVALWGSVSTHDRTKLCSNRILRHERYMAKSECRRILFGSLPTVNHIECIHFSGCRWCCSQNLTWFVHVGYFSNVLMSKIVSTLNKISSNWIKL